MSQLDYLSVLSQAYLPENLRWSKTYADYEVTDPSFKYDFREEIHELPGISLRKGIVASAKYRPPFCLILTDDVQTAAPHFFMVREAAANVARIKGAELARSDYKWKDPKLFTRAMSHFEEISSRITTQVFSGLHDANLGSRARAAIGHLQSRIHFRLENEASNSFIFHAYGKPRSYFTDREFKRWPIQEIDTRLTLQFPQGVTRRLEEELVTLANKKDYDLVYVSGRVGEAAFWSFYFDASETWKNYLPETLLFPDDKWKSIPNLDRIFWSFVRSWVSASRGIQERKNPNTEDTLFTRFVEDFKSVFRLTPAPESTEGIIGPPEKFPYGVSPRGAELLCRDWMMYLGERDAVVSQFTADGGIDILSNDYAAQVKHYKGSVGGPEIQQLVGAAHIVSKKPLFFTSGGYTASALSLAEASQLPLFIYRAEEGTLTAANMFAEPILVNGLSSS